MRRDNEHRKDKSVVEAGAVAVRGGGAPPWIAPDLVLSRCPVSGRGVGNARGCDRFVRVEYVESLH